MKVFHKYDPYDCRYEAVGALALTHRKRFGECPSISMTMADLYAVFRQTAGQLAHIGGGGKMEPLHYSFMTPAGVAMCFEDPECDDKDNTFSVHEPADE